MNSSTAIQKGLDGLLTFGIVGHGLFGAAADNRGLVARELILGEEIADFHFYEVEQFGIIDEVNLIEEDDDGRDADLASEQDVLTGLGHGAFRGIDDQDSAIHLGGARDHVFDEVGVAGAIDMSVMALIALVTQREIRRW